MAYDKDSDYFSISNGPGCYRLIAGDIEMYEKRGNLIVEFTIRPNPVGRELLGHERSFRVPFEVALKGTTTETWFYEAGTKSVRLLGRFVIPDILLTGNHSLPFISDDAALELREWQWEAVFSPNSRTGRMYKLKTPLPEEWTM